MEKLLVVLRLLAIYWKYGVAGVGLALLISAIIYRRKLLAFGRWLHEHYFHMDPRTAGLYRIVVGFLCSADTIRHWLVARTFYSNDGVLTNHWHLFKPSSGYNFSIYHAFSTMEEVHIAFALSLFCHLCLMVGWHARLFSIVTFILMTSLDNRLVMVENGGYVVVNLVTLYCMFLPTDRRFSVDALLRSLRERKERSAADLSQRYLPSWATEDFVSIAAFLVVLNLGVVYFFNVINKAGWIWRKGETVHYVLYLNRMVTGIGVAMRNILPMWATRICTFYVLCHESSLVPLVLWPKARRVTRTLAIPLIWALHTTFGVVFRLGPFSWFMIGWSFSIWTTEQWKLIEGWCLRRAAPRVVVYDKDSPLAFAIMRLLSRMNGLDILTFEESEGDAPPLFAARDQEGRLHTGPEALREIARALPAGRYVYPVLNVITLGALPWLFAAASARREAWARFFGLAASLAEPEVVDRPSPLRLSMWKNLRRVREVFLVYFAVASFLQAIVENKSVPPKIRDAIKTPKAFEATIGYPRLYQGWGMFAPNPITDDGTVVIDARTIDGRRIDPMMGGQPPQLDLTIAKGLGLGQIQQDYYNRIRLDRNKVFRQGLQEYLQHWHQRTGHPEDELVAFDVYWVRDQCPKPGDDKPYANETVAILTWRKPGFRAPPGFPPIPPEPKVETAETSQTEKPAEPRRILGIKLPDFMQ